MALSVVPISSKEAAEFAAEQTDDTPFFAQTWLDAFGEKLRCFGIENNKGKRESVFALFEGKLKGLKVWRAAPFTPHIGPVLRKNDQQSAQQQNETKRVLQAMASFLAQEAATSIVSLNLRPALHDMQPFVWEKFKTAARFTYRIDLADNDYTLNFDKKLSRALEKGKEDGLQSTIALADENALQYANDRLGGGTLAEVDLHYLEPIIQQFCRAENSFCVEVKKSGRVEAFALIVYGRSTAFYIAGGKLQEGAHNAAGSQAVASAIEECKKRGLQIFDFEGSMIPGVERFFRSFGGRLTPYHQINMASFWKEVLLKWKRRESF